jgi:hypothetical protein
MDGFHQSGGEGIDVDPLLLRGIIALIGSS